METIKGILNQLLQFETIDQIISYIESQKSVILTELGTLLPKFSFIISTFASPGFDYMITWLKTFETKDALIIKINFYMEQLHEIAISTVHIINGNDNEVLQKLADNVYTKLNTPV